MCRCQLKPGTSVCFSLEGDPVKTLKKTLAVAAACGMLIAAPAPAVAQETGTTAGVNAATIDPAKTGSLTIVKMANPDSLGEPTGLEDSAVSGDPLEGAGFTLYKVTNADLTTNDGLAKAATLTPENAVAGDEVAADQETTNSEGKQTWSKLPVGVYLVKETSPVEGYQPAPDFLVFVPMTAANKEQGGTSWQYDVVAYPKNYNQNEPTKTVQDSGVNVGQKVTFEIKATPRTMPADKRTMFRIEDTLDPSLTVTEDDITVTGLDGVGYTVTVDGQQVTVKVEGDEAKKIQSGQEVTVTIDANVASMPKGGEIKNQANVFENNPVTGEEEEGKPTNETETYYAGITFKKVGGDGKALEGAKFEVYGAKEGEKCEAAVQNGDAQQTVGDKAEFESGEDGTVTIEGLHVNDTANFDGTNSEANAFVKYCLLETQAPKGFELLSTPVEFTLAKDEKGTMKQLTVGEKEGEIVNLKDTTTRLPNTGGIGVLIFVLAGLGIIGGGVYAARRNSAA